MKIGKLLSFVIFSLLLSACGSLVSKNDSAPHHPRDVSNVPNAIPKDEPKSKYGNPAHYEVFGKRYYTMKSSRGYHEQGIASWYGKKFHGRRTSSGETYDMYAMTAAHKTLPLPTYLEVTNIKNGKKIIVKVNDRGPFHGNRLIDLSYSAAKKLDIIGKGTGLVAIKTVSSGYRSTSQTVTKRGAAVAVYLQIGAFSSKSSAERVRIELQQQVDDTVLVHEAGGLYKVRVGPISNLERGNALVSQLFDLGYSDAHIVTE